MSDHPTAEDLLIAARVHQQRAASAACYARESADAARSIRERECAPVAQALAAEEYDIARRLHRDALIASLVIPIGVLLDDA